MTDEVKKGGRVEKDGRGGARERHVTYIAGCCEISATEFGFYWWTEQQTHMQKPGKRLEAKVPERTGKRLEAKVPERRGAASFRVGGLLEVSAWMPTQTYKSGAAPLLEEQPRTKDC